MIDNNVLTLKSSYYSLLNSVTSNKQDIESLLTFLALYEEKKDDFLYGLIYSYTDYIINKMSSVTELNEIHDFYIKLCNISKIGKQLGDYALSKIKITKDKCINIGRKSINDVVITSPYFNVKCVYKNNLFLAKKCDLISDKLGIMSDDYSDAINTFYSALEECNSIDDISILKNHICLLANVDEKGQKFKSMVYNLISLDNVQSLRQNVKLVTSSGDSGLYEKYYDEYLKIISDDIYDESIIDELIKKFRSLNDANKKDNINNVINHLTVLKSNLNQVSLVSGF